MEELKVGDRVKIVYPRSAYLDREDIIIDIRNIGTYNVSYITKNSGTWGYRSSLELITRKPLTARESLMF